MYLYLHKDKERISNLYQNYNKAELNYSSHIVRLLFEHLLAMITIQLELVSNNPEILSKNLIVENEKNILCI